MTKTFPLKIIGIAIAAGLFVTAWQFFSRTQVPVENFTTETINVLVSIPPQVEFVQEVGGDKVSVIALVPPGESPATYSLTTADLVKLESAQVYFRIGYIPFEKSNIEKIQNTNPDLEIVQVTDNVNLRYFSDEEEHEHAPADEHYEDHAKEDSHMEESEIDPHLWLSVENMKSHVDSIAFELSELSPGNKAYFETNALSYKAKLDTLKKTIESELVNVESKHLLVFHPAWGYLADEYGLEQIAIEQDGKDPTASQISAIIETAREKDIGIMFVQSQFSTSAAEGIANELSIPIVQIDPLAQNYIQNMETISKTLKESL